MTDTATAAQSQPYAVTLILGVLAGWVVGAVIVLAFVSGPDLLAGRSGAITLATVREVLALGLAVSAFGNIALGWPAHHALARRGAGLTGYLSAGAVLGPMVGFGVAFGLLLVRRFPLDSADLGEAMGAAMMALVCLAPASLPAGMASAGVIYRLRRPRPAD